MHFLQSAVLNFGQSMLRDFPSESGVQIQMDLGSLGQDCLNRCTIRLSLLKRENKWPDGGLFSTQQLPQSTTSLIFSYHRPFVMISTTKAEICTHPAAVFHTHSCTHWPRSSAVEEASRSRSPQSSAAIPTRAGAFQSCSGLGTGLFQLPTHSGVSLVLLGADWYRAVCPSVENARWRNR